MKTIILVIILILIDLFLLYFFKKGEGNFKRFFILICNFILLIIIIFFISFYGLKYWIHYERTHVEKIDTSFFSDELRNELIHNIKESTKTINNNINYIEIDKSTITYYDLNHNVLSYNNVLGFKINNLIQRVNIRFIAVYINNNKNIENIEINFIGNKYLYVYKGKKHDYKQGYIIPVLVGRVEKIIDENWYILRDCDRIICQEPQG